MSVSTSTKRKLSLPLVVAGGVSALVLALGMTPTFSAFSASIQNTVDTAGTGTLVMQETNQAGTVLCNSTDATTVSVNSATCATINDYSGDVTMIPGESISTTINIKNTGTVDASTFSLTPGACTQSAVGAVTGTAIDMCAKTTITIVSGGKTIYSGTALALGTGGAIDVNSKLAVAKTLAGSTTPITFTVLMDPTMTNTYQGIKVSQPLTWSFGA